MGIICFSGHRPNKLGGYRWDSYANIKIRNYMLAVLKDYILDNNKEPLVFISGMALGFDQMMFEVVHSLKHLGDIKLIAAVPFKDQPTVWKTEEDLYRYNKQLSQADLIVYVDTLEGYIMEGVEAGKYHVAKLDIRNKYMADMSSEAFILWDGTSGGTCNFVKYANKQSIKLNIINPKDIM